MKLATTTLVALALVLAVAPVATAEEVQNQRFEATILFAEGGSFDEETGSSSYIAYEAAHRAGEPAELFVHGINREPLDCFDGASVFTSFSAFGPATVDVSGRFATATATATLDTVYDTFNECTEEGSTVVEPGVAYAMDLTGEGSVSREREGNSSNTPGTNLFHQNGHSVGRQATGTLTQGSSTIDAFHAFIGKSYGTFHFRPALEALTSLAEAAWSLNESERMNLAALAWSEESELEYHDRVVTVFQDRAGDTLVQVGGVDSVVDPELECAVTTFTEGEGPGSADFGSRLSSVTGTAVVDMYVAVVNECTEEVTETFLSGVEVSFDAATGGQVSVERHVKTLLVPSEEHTVERTRLASRSGDGTFAIDGVSYESFASIARASSVVRG